MEVLGLGRAMLRTPHRGVGGHYSAVMLSLECSAPASGVEDAAPMGFVVAALQEWTFAQDVVFVSWDKKVSVRHVTFDGSPGDCPPSGMPALRRGISARRN